MQIIKNTILALLESVVVIIVLLAVFALILKSAPESYNYNMGVSIFSKITAMGWPFFIGFILQNRVKDVKLSAIFVFVIALILMISACLIVPSSRIDGFNLLFLLESIIAGAVGACVNNLFKDTIRKCAKKFAKH